MRMTKLGGALLGAVFAVAGRGHGRDRAGRSGQLSQQADPRHRAVRGRRRQRHLRAPGRPEAGEILGQPVINENKPGAGGRIAAEYVMNQPHDGYTLFIGASGVMSVAAAAYPNLTYHPTKTFIPLSMIANFPLILVVPPDHPAKNVKELVEWAKKNPDKANYASTSPAFITATELLKLKSGMPGQMIPYKSSNEMILSVMQGQTLLAISDGPPAIPQIKAGKVKALAVTGSERSDELPDVPSMAEAGFPGGQHQAVERLFRGAEHAARDRRQARGRVAQGHQRSGRELASSRRMAVTPGGNSSADFRKMIDARHQGLSGRDQGGESEVRQLDSSAS